MGQNLRSERNFKEMLEPPPQPKKYYDYRIITPTINESRWLHPYASYKLQSGGATFAEQQITLKFPFPFFGHFIQVIFNLPIVYEFIYCNIYF